MSRCVNNQQLLKIGEAEAGYNGYVSDKSDLAIDKSWREVPLKYVSLRNHHVGPIAFK